MRLLLSSRIVWTLLALATAGSGCTLPQSMPKLPNPLKKAAPEDPLFGDTAATPFDKKTTPEDERKQQIALARVQEGQGNHRGARDIYQKLLKKYPNEVAAYHGLALMAAKEEQYQEAEQYFRQAYALAPKNVELLNDIGYFFYKQDRLDEAEQTLRTARAEQFNDPRVLSNLALVVGVKGNLEEAFDLYQRANQGKLAETYNNMGFVHSQRAEFDKAQEYYVKALDRDKELRSAADGLVQLKELKNAESSFAKKFFGDEPVGPLPPQVESIGPSHEPRRLVPVQPDTFAAVPQPTHQAAAEYQEPVQQANAAKRFDVQTAVAQHAAQQGNIEQVAHVGAADESVQANAEPATFLAAQPADDGIVSTGFEEPFIPEVPESVSHAERLPAVAAARPAKSTRSIPKPADLKAAVLETLADDRRKPIGTQKQPQQKGAKPAVPGQQPAAELNQTTDSSQQLQVSIPSNVMPAFPAINTTPPDLSKLLNSVPQPGAQEAIDSVQQ